MLRIACVTTFNEKLYSEYAYRMLDSYSWPFDFFVYTEDFSRHLYNHRITEVRDIFALEPECKAFVDRNKDKAVSFYLYDAVRFCYKAFTISHFGLNEKEYDRLIFFDADFVFTNKEITSEFVNDKICGDDEMMAYFGRDRDVVHYSETGFLAFNLKHPHCLQYLSEVRDIYVTDYIYEIPNQTDSLVFDITRETFSTKYNIETRDLSSDSDRRHNHPMASSFMNSYFDHVKGERKNLLHSPEWLKSRGIIA